MYLLPAYLAAWILPSTYHVRTLDTGTFRTKSGGPTSRVRTPRCSIYIFLCNLLQLEFYKFSGKHRQKVWYILIWTVQLIRLGIDGSATLTVTRISCLFNACRYLIESAVCPGPDWWPAQWAERRRRAVCSHPAQQKLTVRCDTQDGTRRAIFKLPANRIRKIGSIPRKEIMNRVNFGVLSCRLEVFMIVTVTKHKANILPFLSFFTKNLNFKLFLTNFWSPKTWVWLQIQNNSLILDWMHTKKKK